MGNSSAQLIYAAAVITMNDAGEIFSPGYLRVKDKLITEVGAGRPAAADGETVHDLNATAHDFGVSAAALGKTAHDAAANDHDVGDTAHDFCHNANDGLCHRTCVWCH